MLVEIMKMNKEEVTVVTSLDVAETFGKEHKNVLRDIRELECSDDFRRLNFAQPEYEWAEPQTTNVLHDKRRLYYSRYGIYRR